MYFYFTCEGAFIFFGLSFSVEGERVDSVRADINLIQTEWDVCVRELQAARERVHTQSRLRAVSAELADLDRAFEEQDQWLDSTPTVEKCNEAGLRSLSGECQVRVSVYIPIHPDLLCVTLILTPNPFLNSLAFRSCSCSLKNSSVFTTEMKHKKAKWIY